MITFSTLSPTAFFTAAISFFTSSYWPFFSQPMLMTISTSEAPFSMALAASKHLLSVSIAPRGKPTTQHTGILPCIYSAACFT